MRIFYAILKAVTFCWLMLVYALPANVAAFWEQWSVVFVGASRVLVVSSVSICLLRAAPVVIEFIRAERHMLLGSLLRGNDTQLQQVD